MAEILLLSIACSASVAIGYAISFIQHVEKKYRDDAGKRLEILDLRAALLQTAASLEQADCREGYCCCGDLEVNHSFTDNHAFTDEGVYRKHLALQAAHDVLALRHPQ